MLTTKIKKLIAPSIRTNSILIGKLGQYQDGLSRKIWPTLCRLIAWVNVKMMISAFLKRMSSTNFSLFGEIKAAAPTKNGKLAESIWSEKDHLTNLSEADRKGTSRSDVWLLDLCIPSKKKLKSLEKIF